MIDTRYLDTIGAKIETIMDKKFSKLKLAQGSSNVSSTNEKFFFCKICVCTNHDTSYCGGSNSEHVAAVNYGEEGCNQEGALVMNYDGYGYNPDCVAIVIYGGKIQGYAHQSSYNNQPFRPPFNSNPSQENFNQGYNQSNHVPYSNQPGRSLISVVCYTYCAFLVVYQGL